MFKPAIETDGGVIELKEETYRKDAGAVLFQVLVAFIVTPPKIEHYRKVKANTISMGSLWGQWLRFRRMESPI